MCPKSPISVIFPLSKFIIISALKIVYIRWAIIKTKGTFIPLILLRTYCYVFLSKADVPSSKTNIYGFLTKALAIAILCFCPPLSIEY